MQVFPATCTGRWACGRNFTLQGVEEEEMHAWLTRLSVPQVVGGAWLFSRLYCNIFVTLDVMMCTASILNLCAISIDR